ncbi:hypothetical protein N7462_006760 [Penicillium macrosclerotiorum]|uniref:uncharacterized protein n=1 Tax=Penicillium macrosclerotiorum TaxID=303699 RepID=UPI00254866ED|nr:uncharacterized protein N7462_006760 [Penicillium macrosclerotiorum]KAJ5683595.1 hypothetical protein N7462_006760 [Penicillium macrosclerotiorum]
MPDKTPKNIRPLNRFITTHDAAGTAIFSNTLSEDMPIQRMGDGADFSLVYTSDHFPAQLNGDADLKEYTNYLSSPPRDHNFDWKFSLDYGVVLEGEVELLLDSGETRLLKRGDVAIQRGTNHAWRNVTPDVVDPVTNEKTPQWARMLYVLSPAQPMTIGGTSLGEVVDGIGVRAST